MSYQYGDEKAFIFTEEGQLKFLAVRDFAAKALAISGAVSAGKLLSAAGSGDSWKNMACVDRLVEINELRELPTKGPWQQRVFVNAKED